MTYSGAKDQLIFPERRKALHGRDFPYWWRFARGRSLGYCKGISVASWFVRFRSKEGKYRQTRLGDADDVLSPDGERVLSFDQALSKAGLWCEEYSGTAIPRHMDHEQNPVYPELPSPPPYTVAHAMVDYMCWYRENRRGFKVVYYTTRAFILPKLGDTALDKLDTKTIREWIDNLADTPARISSGRSKEVRHRLKSNDPEILRRRRNSTNRILSILKAGLNRAYEYGYVDSNLAWNRVKKFRRVNPAIPNYLEKNQCHDLVAECPPDLHKLVVGALVSGCRAGELRRLLVSDYLADLKRLIIRGPKGGRPRHVSLSDEGVSFFNQLTKNRASNEIMFLRKDGRPWRTQTYHRPYRKACYAAGLEPKVKFHTLRHTYATHAAMAGIPLAVIAKQLGHRDTRMVERNYAHFGSSYVDEVIQERLPSLVSGG